MAFVATTLPVKVGLAVLASHLALAAASVAVADMRSGATRRAATAPRVRAHEMGLIFDFFCVGILYLRARFRLAETAPSVLITVVQANKATSAWQCFV